MISIHNLDKRQTEVDLASYKKTDSYFIVANFEDIEKIGDILGIMSYSKNTYENIDGNLKFEQGDRCDFISFVFFDLQDGAWSFEKINLYRGENFMLLVVDDKNDLYSRIAGDLKIGNAKTVDAREELGLLYYRFFNGTISKMFDTLSRYEEQLIDMEVKILTSPSKDDFGGIVEMKGTSFKIKKYLRYLLHVGDQLTDNENRLIPAKQMKSFRNLDFRINRLYEFSDGLHEMTEHLMDLYDSSVTSRTNNLINKLTIVTVFGTPLTVISGIYGMNFVNMPELQSEYGYFIVLGIMSTSVAVTYLILKKIRLL